MSKSKAKQAAAAAIKASLEASEDAAKIAAAKTEVQPTAPAKLTKRNATPTTALLVATDKAPKSRADHVKNAWNAVLAVLPSTAAELAKLPELADAKCVSPQAFLSYMQRRGFLTVKS